MKNIRKTFSYDSSISDVDISVSICWEGSEDDEKSASSTILNYLGTRHNINITRVDIVEDEDPTLGETR